MHELTRLAGDAGISLTEAHAKKLDVYRDLLLEWNEKMNLTGITEPAEVHVKHFVDSLLVLPTGWIPQGAAVIDVGSGAGFPGLPLAVVREDLSVVYADSLRKRLGFLDEVIRKLDIKHNETIHARAEDLGRHKDHREHYDVAIARAVASMEVLAEYTLPFVKPGGCLIAWKGPKAKEEVRAAESAVKKLGAEICALHTVRVHGMERVLVRVDKIKSTPPRYPRKPAAIKQKPL